MLPTSSSQQYWIIFYEKLNTEKRELPGSRLTVKQIVMLLKIWDIFMNKEYIYVGDNDYETPTRCTQEKLFYPPKMNKYELKMI